jgi:hypothetical protein
MDYLDYGDATVSLYPVAAQIRIRPVFDAENVLTHIVVERSYDGWETVFSADEWVPDAPATCAALAGGVAFGGVFLGGGNATVTSANRISRATIGTGDLRVTGPLGYDEVATLVSIDQAADAGEITATYSIPPPEGNIWCSQYNGTYTVFRVASQVADLAGTYVAAGSLGTFLCDISGEPILEPLFLAGYLMAATETLVFPMELVDGTALDDNATPTVLIRTTAGTWVAPTSGPTNDGHGHYSVTVTSTTHFAAYGTLQLLATASGCRPTCQAYKAGPIAADTQAIDGDFDAATHDRSDIEGHYQRGVVVSDYDYSYDYDYGYTSGGCTSTVTEFCVFGLTLREDSAEIGTTGLYRYGYARQMVCLDDGHWLVILKSVTLGDYTRITVASAHLPSPPAAGTQVTIGGCTAPEQAEA